MDIDRIKSQFIEALQPPSLQQEIQSCENLSDLMSCLWDKPGLYYAHLGDRLPYTLEDAVSADLLENYGILINPSDIPDSTLNAYIALYTKPISTRQTQDKTVSYFGNVKLDISAGYGNLYTSKYPATAHGTVFLEAYGQTRVNAGEDSSVTLHDYALCDSKENALVSATDYSFVQSLSKNNLMLSGHALGIIVEGPVKATLFDNCQLMVSRVDGPEKLVHVTMYDESTIYTSKEALDCEILLKNRFNGNVISGKELDLSAEHLAALLYIQHPLLAHRPTPEHIQELTERFGGRLPNWVKTQIMPTKETASQKLSPRGLVR